MQEYKFIRIKAETYNKLLESSKSFNISLLSYLDSLSKGLEIDYVSVEDAMQMLNLSRYKIEQLCKAFILQKNEFGYIYKKSLDYYKQIY